MATLSQGVPTTQRHYGNQPVPYGIRVGNLFIIELTKEMFIDNGSEKIYFQQCLEAYINILRKKLSHNKEDWMGLIFCRANKPTDDLSITNDDNDPEPEGLLTIQKFSLIDRDMFFDISKAYTKDIEYWKNLCSDEECSIGDVLIHAARTINGVKKVMSGRRVIFITCNDNPSPHDIEEQNKIRINAKSFKDIDIKLQVIGLGEEFDYNCFYKEVEMLSEFSGAREFKMMNLKDLEEDIIHRSHVAGHMDLRIQPNMYIRVSIQGFCKSRKHLREIPASKATNEPLDRYSWWSFDQDISDELDDELNTFLTQKDPETLKKMISYGQRNIFFTLDEFRKMRNMRPRGIDLLGFKPKDSRDPLYQIHPPLFVGCHSGATKCEMEFFAALLSRMNAKNLKAICAVTLKTALPTRLFEMWPCTKYGGFYIHRMPFKEDVRHSLDDITEGFNFTEDNPPPINDLDINLMKHVAKKLYFSYDPKMFKNPRLQKQMDYVESLALELPPGSPPVDTTLPNEDDINERLRRDNLLQRYKDNFGCHALQEQVKVKRLEVEWVRNALREQQLHKYTVDVLKSMLKTLDQRIQGKKQELIDRLEEYRVKHLVE
ncbi:X-ray repair cross-complementing protein 6 [Chelonus insularis]|uniref:X-ray repair cross-complementing protein 6 n=1 Tax=Chelonus insularis TaxID=460826 RepID=UPI0015895DC8|nr:X-ray repair cross-complementing protein 6-like [Chelonus insularis]